MKRKLLSLKASILAFEIAFIFCFFIGIFWNTSTASSKIVETYDENHRFYINRGYPIAWAGTSALDKKVDFPIIKVPFVTRILRDDGSKWNKIIDLKVFLPLFASVFLISYIFTFLFINTIKKSRYLKYILFPIYTVLLLLGIFVYFVWFPHV